MTKHKSKFLINANSNEELDSMLRLIDITVPPRAQGRKTEHTERWSICRWLSTLNKYKCLTFPLRLNKRESPDFELIMRYEKWGIEISEAIPEDYAKASAMAEREKPNAIIDPSLFKRGDKRKNTNELKEIINQNKLTGEGWEGDAPEREFAKTITDVIKRKTGGLLEEKFDKYPKNVLLIYHNIPLPILNLNKATNYLAKELIGYWSEKMVFNTIYVEAGDMIFVLTASRKHNLQINDVWKHVIDDT